MAKKSYLYMSIAAYRSDKLLSYGILSDFENRVLEMAKSAYLYIFIGA